MNFLTIHCFYYKMCFYNINNNDNVYKLYLS